MRRGLGKVGDVLRRDFKRVVTQQLLRSQLRKLTYPLRIPCKKSHPALLHRTEPSAQRMIEPDYATIDRRKTAPHFCWKCSLLPHCPTQNRFALLLEML